MQFPHSIEATRQLAFVFGTVRDSVGAPIADAIVMATGFKNPCQPTMMATTQGTAGTNALGFYRIRLVALMGPGTECVAVNAHRPNGVSVTAIDSAVVFNDAGDPPYDSVRVDVTVR